jgi:hypothetical protein
MAESHYTVSNERQSYVVGYDGAFLLDPRTLDLVRLTVRAVDPPTGLRTCELTTTIEYQGVRINDSEFQLAKDVTLQVIYPDGTEMENHTAFSGCHEFVGQSSLRFDATPDAGQRLENATPATKLVVPAGLPFKISLSRPIETATAAAGDPFGAELIYPIKDGQQRVLVPKGATVTGRILEMKRTYGPGSDALIVALMVENIETNGRTQKFDASLGSRLMDMPGVHSSLTLDVSEPRGPGVGVLSFHNVKSNYVIRRGMQIAGFTGSH